MLERNSSNSEARRLSEEFSGRFRSVASSFLRNTEVNESGFSETVKDLDVDIWYSHFEKSLTPLYEGHTDFETGTEMAVFKPDRISVKTSEDWRELETGIRPELWISLGYILRGTKETTNFLCLNLDAHLPAFGTSFVFSEQNKEEDYSGHDYKDVILSEKQLEDLYFILSQVEKGSRF